jgi:putative endonuclease
VKVDAVLRRQLVTGITATSKLRRGGTERANKRPRERLRCAVPGVERDVDDRIVSCPQPVRSALKQQSATKCARRLTQRGAHQPIKVKPGQVSASGEIGTGDAWLVETLLDQLQDPAQTIGAHHFASLVHNREDRLIVLAQDPPPHEAGCHSRAGRGPSSRRRSYRPMSEAWVYLLRCADGSLYTGWTIDLERRLSRHRAGTASRYTASRLPVELAHSIPMPDRTAARREEARVKRLSRADKLALLSAAQAAGRTNPEGSGAEGAAAAMGF